MKKWITLLKSAVISFIIYMWFLGSSLLIHIDKQSEKDMRIQNNYILQRKVWNAELNNLSVKVLANCEKVRKSDEIENETKALERDHSAKDEEKAKHILAKARREKAFRDNLIYIPELEQMWCLVPKAASTFWSHKITEFLPPNNVKLQHNLRNGSIPVQVTLRKHYGNVSMQILNKLRDSKEVSKILLIRHPFARIVSAFEDKLKNRKAKSDSMYFYGHYGVKINRSFRRNRRSNKRKEPIFEEFIDYLIETDPLDYDEHWKPISLLCGVCRMQYNHIIRQEGLGKSLNFHLSSLGFQDDVSEHAKAPGENKSEWEFANVYEYFKNISHATMEKLYMKYEDDFTLFGYDYNPKM